MNKDNFEIFRDNKHNTYSKSAFPLEIEDYKFSGNGTKYFNMIEIILKIFQEICEFIHFLLFCILWSISTELLAGFIPELFFGGKAKIYIEVEIVLRRENSINFLQQSFRL